MSLARHPRATCLFARQGHSRPRPAIVCTNAPSQASRWFSSDSSLLRSNPAHTPRRQSSSPRPPLSGASGHSRTGGPFRVRIPLQQNVRTAFKLAYDNVKDTPLVRHMGREDMDFEKAFADFKAPIVAASGRTGRRLEPELQELVESLVLDNHSPRGVERMVSSIQHAFYAHITRLRVDEAPLAKQDIVVGFEYPAEWYPASRAMQRTIHLHVGPTNSGKTYHALKRLEKAARGLYAGPLRLLAHEVYSRMTAAGIKCALITGEERRLPDGVANPAMVSSTVEMVSLHSHVDVAVIDEIQMLGDTDRGWAWTQALLGVRATEIHLCGEKRAVPLVQAICAQIGEVPIVHEYERLSPLHMESASLRGDLSGLRRGDCIVSFSVMSIHALRKAIESKTGKRVAIVYGSLPPEIRAQQARLFNDPDNDYDFLVASDAIGMGLNLSVKRIIFETSIKFDGQVRKAVDTAHMKQIAGRAGRYKTAPFDGPIPVTGLDLPVTEKELVATERAASIDATDENPKEIEAVAKAAESNAVNKTDMIEHIMNNRHIYTPTTSPVVLHDNQYVTNGAASPYAPGSTPPPNDPGNYGLVTTLDIVDYPFVKRALQAEPPPLRSAGLLPTSEQVDRFAQYFPPGTPFSYILTRLTEMAPVGSLYHTCGLKDSAYIADLIEPVEGLGNADRLVFTAAPIGRSSQALWSSLVPELARFVERNATAPLYDIESLPLELLSEEVQFDRGYLQKLEALHKGLVLYLWLSYRFAGVFNTRPLAMEVKSMVEDKITQVLAAISSEDVRAKKALKRAEEQAGQEVEQYAEQSYSAVEALEDMEKGLFDEDAAARKVDGRAGSGPLGHKLYDTVPDAQQHAASRP